jgi:hypothetical protein
MSEAYFSEGSEAMLALEAMVDKVGLRNVVYALAHICDAKAEHCHSNWQDHALAKRWENDAHKLDAIANRINGY